MPESASVRRKGIQTHQAEMQVKAGRQLAWDASDDFGSFLRQVLVACPLGLRPVEIQDAAGLPATSTSSPRLLLAMQTCVDLYIIVSVWQNILHQYKLLDMAVFIHHLVPIDVIVMNCLTRHNCIAILGELCLVGRHE